MFDQAKQLRQLAENFAQPGRSVRGSRPRLIAVTAGMGKSGTTTVAANVAAGLAMGRRKTLLIDVDSQCGAVARLCGVKPLHTVADLLSGRRGLSAVLHKGPVGLDVVPGVRGLEKLSDYPADAIGKLVEQLDTTDPATAYVVLDLGSRLTDLSRRIWEIADMAVVVATPGADQILETYTLIKTMTGSGSAAAIRLVVNRVVDRSGADDIFTRLEQAAKRFLDIQLGALGWLADDPMIEAAHKAGNLLTTAAANCESSKALRSMAEMIAYESMRMPLVGGSFTNTQPITTVTQNPREQLPPTLTTLAALLEELKQSQESKRA